MDIRRCLLVSEDGYQYFQMPEDTSRYSVISTEYSKISSPGQLLQSYPDHQDISNSSPGDHTSFNDLFVYDDRDSFLLYDHDVLGTTLMATALPSMVDLRLILSTDNTNTSKY